MINTSKWTVEKFNNDPKEIHDENALFSTGNRISIEQVDTLQWQFYGIAIMPNPQNWGRIANKSANQHKTFRYTNDVYFQAGEYVFTYTCDDGLRFFINNILVNPTPPQHSSWTTGDSRTYTANYTFLSDNVYKVRVEYFNHGDEGNLIFGWLPKSLLNQPLWTRERFDSSPPTTPDENQLFGNLMKGETTKVMNIDMGAQPSMISWSGIHAVPIPLNRTWRYTNRIPFKAGKYEFTYICGDGLRFYIDDILVKPETPTTDSWIIQDPTMYNVMHNIQTDGLHDIRLEYYNTTVKGHVKFLWKFDQIIPPGEVVLPPPAPPTWINGRTDQTIDGNPPAAWAMGADNKWYPPTPTYFNGITQRVESGSAPTDWVTHSDQYWYPPNEEDYIPNPPVDLTTMVFISPPIDTAIVRQYQKGSSSDIESQLYNITNRSNDIAMKIEMYGQTGIIFTPTGFDIRPLETKQVDIKFSRDFFESLPLGTSATDMWINLSATALTFTNEIHTLGSKFMLVEDTPDAIAERNRAAAELARTAAIADRDAARTAAATFWYNGVTNIRESGNPPSGWVQQTNGTWKPPLTAVLPTINFTYNQMAKTTTKVDGLAQLSTTGELSGYRINWNFDYDGVGAGRMTNNNNLAPTITWIMTSVDYDNVRIDGYTTRKVEVRAIHPIDGTIQSLKTVQLIPDYGNLSGAKVVRPNKNLDII